MDNMDFIKYPYIYIYISNSNTRSLNVTRGGNEVMA